MSCHNNNNMYTRKHAFTSIQNKSNNNNNNNNIVVSYSFSLEQNSGVELEPPMLLLLVFWNFCSRSYSVCHFCEFLLPSFSLCGVLLFEYLAFFNLSPDFLPSFSYIPNITFCIGCVVWRSSPSPSSASWWIVDVDRVNF